ncbi:hypothetical protein OMP38_14075 [Cohnella ginsengisoli]|uniref:Uncharacterized protein n=1 Tax=Cohnella ginsengisoli TaxID=425004 RepID=A0A9X4KH43_9BACL|nr:hypothetical protein [Cohnella ginsengisoli]MDG0791863.1 hypothetical protein [Cohnella ginsengisoli]
MRALIRLRRTRSLPPPELAYGARAIQAELQALGAEQSAADDGAAQRSLAELRVAIHGELAVEL